MVEKFLEILIRVKIFRFFRTHQFFSFKIRNFPFSSIVSSSHCTRNDSQFCNRRRATKLIDTISIPAEAMLTFRVARKLSTHDAPSFTSGKHLENLVIVKQIDICRLVPCKFPLWVERKAVNHANTRALVDRINFRSRDPWRARFWIIENRIVQIVPRNFWVAGRIYLECFLRIDIIKKKKKMLKQ